MSNRKVILILVAALLVRVYLVFFTYCLTNDAWGYIQLAKYISSGDIDSVLEHEQHPLYPCLVAISHFFVRDWVVAGQLVSVIFGTLTTITAYFLTREIFSEKVALLTAVLFAIHPYMCRFSVEIITDSTYIFFFLSSVWFGQMGIEKDSYGDSRNGAESSFCWCGLLAGLAYLTRPEGGGVMVVLTCWLAGRAARRWLFGSTKDAISNRAWLTSIRCLIYLILSFALVSSLYLLDIRFRTGHWRLTKKKKVAEILLLREGQLSKTYRIIGKSPNANKLKKIIPRSPKKYKGSWRGAPYVYGAVAVLKEYTRVYHYPLVALLVIGLIGRQNDPRWRWNKNETYLVPFILLYLAVIYGLAVSASYLSGRHTLSLVALSLCWGSVGIFRMSEWAADKLGNVSIFKTDRRALVAVTVFVLAVVLPKTLKPQRSEGLGLKLAGRAIKKRSGPNVVILSDSSQIALYADGIYINLNGAFMKKKWENGKKRSVIDVSYQAILDYAAEKSAKYLAIRRSYLRKILSVSGDSVHKDNRLSLIFRISEFGEIRSLTDSGDGDDIEVYKIVLKPQEESIHPDGSLPEEL